MSTNDMGTRVGVAGISLTLAFYALYLPGMAPDSRRIRHAFRAAPASLAGVLRTDPRQSYLEPISVSRPFVQAGFVPESRVVNDIAEIGGEADSSAHTEEGAYEIEGQGFGHVLSLLEGAASEPGRTSGLATIQEFFAMDEEMFEMDDADLDIPDLEESVQGTPFTFRKVRVAAGQTIREIAAREKLPADQLAVVNARSADGRLAPGEQILVPMSLGTLHVVQRKESLFSLARQYRVDVATLMFLNKAKQSTMDLRVGESLFIPLGPIPAETRAEIAAHKGIRNLIENRLAFAWPVHGRLSSRFGWRLHPIFHRGRMHRGIDIAVPRGTPILAAERGRVVWASWRGGAGLCVMVKHANGMHSIYMHCSKILVRRGDHVHRKQRLALVGDTGLATGPHLHFSLKRGGEMINPLKFLSRNEL